MHQAQNQAAGARSCVVGQKERVERVQGGLSKEGTMEMSRVCACARTFTRGRGQGAPGTKPSCQGLVFSWGRLISTAIVLRDPRGERETVISSIFYISKPRCTCMLPPYPNLLSPISISHLSPSFKIAQHNITYHLREGRGPSSDRPLVLNVQ